MEYFKCIEYLTMPVSNTSKNLCRWEAYFYVALPQYGKVAFKNESENISNIKPYKRSQTTVI